jgi:predicted RNase H-like HicB family nuclease/DNA-binding XRE family transcriptional regulator
VEYRATLAREGRSTLIEFPDCPGCVTFAERKREIRSVAREALEGWLEAHLAGGDVPPKPSVIRKVSGTRDIAVSINPLLAVRLQIRWARQDRGLSQSGLGDLLGVSRQQVALLEAPDGNPTIRTLEHAAQALGMELAIELRKPHAA